MLIKCISAEVKDLDEKGMVKFQFSEFDFLDTDGDITRKGAFAKTISENIKRIKHFKNHDRWQAPGVIKELWEEKNGAFATSQLILDSTLGRDTYAEYKAGQITEHSYGYDIINSKQIEVEAETGGMIAAQELVELRLKEVSSLNAWGASERTPTLEVKTEKDILEYLSVLEDLKKGDFTDEYFMRLEKRIAAVHSHLKTLYEPGLKTDTTQEPLIEIMKHSYLFNNN